MQVLLLTPYKQSDLSLMMFRIPQQCCTSNDEENGVNARTY